MNLDVSRRKFLLGSAAMAAGLVGCGSSKPAAKKITAPSTAVGESLNVLLSTGPLVAGSPQRIAFVLKSDEFVDPKKPVTAAFGTAQGETSLGSTDCIVYRDSQAAPAYIITRKSFTTEGSYWMRVTTGGKTADSPIEVSAADAAPSPGEAMPAHETPTVADKRNVDPICTQDPPCSLHEKTLADELSGGKALALLVATPRFCSSETCGPVLEILLEAIPTYESRMRFLHVEVYTDTTAKVLSPTVKSLQLASEPALFIVGTDGKVIDRLDGVFGTTELRAVLDRAR